MEGPLCVWKVVLAFSAHSVRFFFSESLEKSIDSTSRISASFPFSQSRDLLSHAQPKVLWYALWERPPPLRERSFVGRNLQVPSSFIKHAFSACHVPGTLCQRRHGSSSRKLHTIKMRGRRGGHGGFRGAERRKHQVATGNVLCTLGPSSSPSSLLTHTFLAMRDCGGGTRLRPLHVFRPTEGPALCPPPQGWSLQPPAPHSVGGGPTPPLALGESQAMRRSWDSLTRHW